MKRGGPCLVLVASPVCVFDSLFIAAGEHFLARRFHVGLGRARLPTRVCFRKQRVRD